MTEEQANWKPPALMKYKGAKEFVEKVSDQRRVYKTLEDLLVRVKAAENNLEGLKKHYLPGGEFDQLASRLEAGNDKVEEDLQWLRGFSKKVDSRCRALEGIAEGHELRMKTFEQVTLQVGKMLNHLKEAMKGLAASHIIDCDQIQQLRSDVDNLIERRTLDLETIQGFEAELQSLRDDTHG